MNRKEVKTVKEVDEFIEPLATGEFVIDIKQLPGGQGFAIEWQKHKTYVAFGDGKEYPDELWRAEDGKLWLVQDLEPDHCKNILRMILRRQRETEAALNDLVEAMVEEVMQDDNTSEDTAESDHGKMLH